MTDEPLIRSDDGPVAVIRINRPRVLNAFSTEMFEGLRRQLEAMATEDSIRAVVLTGEGRAFSSGIDLKELAARVQANGPDGERATIEVIQRITRAIAYLPQVVLAAVNGPAVGFGAELAVAADIRIAVPEATFSFPEVRRGLFATGGSTKLLQSLVGSGRATEWLLSGRTISAEEALAAGLVTKVVREGRLLEAATRQAGRIGANAPLAVGHLKRLLRAAPDSPLDEVFRREVEAALRCLASDDFPERIRSFLERRPTRFTRK